MCHKKIRIPKESANETMRALGNLEDGVEFVDLTQDDIEAKKNFGSMLKRCEDMIKKINDFNTICEDFNIENDNFKNFDEFNNELNNDIIKKDKTSGSIYFDFLESEILENDKQLSELVDNHSSIREDLVNLIEKKYVLKKTSELLISNNQFLNNNSISNNNNNIRNDNIEEDIISTSNPDNNFSQINIVDNISFISGVIKLNDELKMKRMIFRVSRGRAIASFYDLVINKDEYLFTSSIRSRGFSFANKNKNKKNDYNITNSNIFNEQKKVIFNILFQGGVENVLLGKILKICEIFQASRYNVPKANEIQNEISKVENEIIQKKNLIIQTEKSINDIIIKINRINDKSIKYSLYKFYFLQEKIIYSILNKCIVRENFIDGEIWIPERSINNLINNINAVFQGKDDKLRANITNINEENDFSIPPTYIKTNDFIYPFQEIVNTYGIPRYREINPGFFNVITFPFLFGVMFGDIGHSLILFIFSLYICFNKKNIENKNSFLINAIPYRYFILLMGFFGMYCGFMYNDFLSIPINFPTCFTDKVNEQYLNNTNETNITFYELNKTENCNYLFGIDPIWIGASNELTVVNSLKMKLSVIFGFLQMILGIFLKGLNSIFEGDLVEFLFVFLPQLLLMSILFGYMNLLIIIKWNQKYLGEDSKKAPDIKSIMMDIFLKPNGEYNQNFAPIWGNPKLIQQFHFAILIMSVISILIMIIPTVIGKNYQEKYKYEYYENQNKNILNNQNDYSEGLIENNKKEIIKKSFSDILIHVLIESIEFVLGTVSNTASYLRLWALSLAHSQLSKVFFNGTIGIFSNTNSIIINSILLSTSGIIAFFIITSIVLLFMDMMECFLHTLRLHWVEFQNKFYYADGYLFKPFCFKTNLEFNDKVV